MFAALGARNYRFYWVGLVFYVLGHRAEYVTFAWLVWEVTRDPLFLGYLGLAQGGPLLVFQLCGGVLADRMDRLRLLIATQILTAPSTSRAGWRWCPSPSIASGSPTRSPSARSPGKPAG